MNARDYAGTFLASYIKSRDGLGFPPDDFLLAVRYIAHKLYELDAPSALSQKYFDDALVALVAGALTSSLPRYAFNETTSKATIPLYAATPDLPGLIDEMSAPFLKPYSKRIFPKLNLQLEINRARASGLGYPAYEKFVRPSEYKTDDPQRLIWAYLGETPLADLLYIPIPFSIPRGTYCEHAAIFAPTGHGKTQTLQSTIHGFLQESDPPGMFIIDSTGKMISRIEQLDIFHPHTGRLRDRLIIYDPKDLPPLNFFQLTGGEQSTQVYEMFHYLFSAIDRDLTAKMTTAVIYLIDLMSHISNPSITLLKDLMEADPKHPPPRFTNAISQLGETGRKFFTNQFFSGELKGTRAQVANRLYSLLANARFEKMFAAEGNSFDALKCMHEKKIVLINSDYDTLGQHASTLFARYFIAQIMNAAFKRGEGNRDLCLLVIDEASDVLDDTAERILSRARQYGLGLVFATQYIEQMPEKVKEAVNGNTAIKMAGPVSYTDANALGREMYTTGEFVRSMKKVDHSHAEFATYVRGYTPRAIRLTIPYGTLENAPRMDRDAHARMREKNRASMTSTKVTPPPARGEDDPELKPSKRW